MNPDKAAAFVGEHFVPCMTPVGSDASAGEQRAEPSPNGADSWFCLLLRDQPGSAAVTSSRAVRSREPPGEVGGASGRCGDVLC